MQSTLVAINVIGLNGKLLNNKNIPLLFYWDGEGDIKDSLKSNSEFIEFLNNNVINFEHYTYAQISLCYFKSDENKNETYADLVFNVQDVFLLSYFNENTLYKTYLLHHFLYLYESAYHEKYPNKIGLSPIDSLDINDVILDIYDKVQEKYPKRVIKSTVINYIKQELENTNCLNKDNVNLVITKLENLLNEKQ